jgi:hypothetical protein
MLPEYPLPHKPQIAFPFACIQGIPCRESIADIGRLRACFDRSTNLVGVKCWLAFPAD